MTKGIREFTVNTFNSTLPQLKELGNTKFRAEVMNLTIMAFGVTISSAATHYNHALQLAKANNPTAVEGLGRPADKKGGRKPIHVVDVVKVHNGEVVATGVSRAVAAQLVQAAVTAKKTKLAIKEPVVAAAAPVAETAATDSAITEGAAVDTLDTSALATATETAPEASTETAGEAATA